MPLYRVAAEYEASGTQLVNVWHVDGPASSEALIGNAFESAVWPRLQNVMGLTVNGVQVVVTDVDQLTQAVVPLTGTGSQSGDLLPLQAAALISWRTGLIGRANRGRSYIPGLTEGAQSGGVIEALTLNNLNVLGNAILVTWTGLFAGQLVIRHNTTLPSWTTVTAFILRNIMATQRRRRPGVGT